MCKCSHCKDCPSNQEPIEQAFEYPNRVQLVGFDKTLEGKVGHIGGVLQRTPEVIVYAVILDEAIMVQNGDEGEVFEVIPVPQSMLEGI